jgi:hypothetical protein
MIAPAVINRFDLTHLGDLSFCLDRLDGSDQDGVANEGNERAVVLIRLLAA